jgi:Flp pilus assembly protein TadD
MSGVMEHLREGWAYQQAGALDAAERSYRRALEVDRDSAEGWCLLGALDVLRQRYEGAVASFTEYVRLAPRSAEAHNNLAVALSEVGRLEEAAAHGREAVRLKPDYIEARNNLGLVLRDLRRHDEARRTFEEGLQRAPNHAETLNNLGVLLIEMGHLVEAIKSLRKAIQVNPNYAEAWLNLGNAHRDGGQVAEAEAAYDRAIQVRPDYAEAHHHRALLRLLIGNYATGWPLFEWRWRCRNYPGFHIGTPRWDGTPRPNTTLFVFAEQGLGDATQFARFLPEAASRVGRLILDVPRELTPLLGRIRGVSEVRARTGEVPPHNLHVPLLSLPGVLGLEELPRPPYIIRDPALVHDWRTRLAEYEGLKVGLFWKGNPLLRNDPRRSPRPTDYAPLASLKGVTWFRLQPRDASDDEVVPLPMVEPRSIGQADALDELAALITGLDLVITPDTFGAHLAGALDVPVWIALPAAHEWRWGIGRDDSPWYPSARLFRQPSPGRWDLVFQRMAEELAREVVPKPVVARVSIDVSPAELLDRLTILEIKRERISDPAKRTHVEAEHAELSKVRVAVLPRSVHLDDLTADLKDANVAIWDVEEVVRRCERAQDFGPEFIAAARTVYRENDRRAAIKRAINDFLGAAIQEVKSHSPIA